MVDKAEMEELFSRRDFRYLSIFSINLQSSWLYCSFLLRDRLDLVIGFEMRQGKAEVIEIKLQGRSGYEQKQ